MKVIFSKKKSITLTDAVEWTEAFGIIVFSDKNNRMVATMTAVEGVIIENNDGKDQKPQKIEVAAQKY